MITLSTLRTLVLAALVGSQLGLAACGSSTNVQPQIPGTIVNELINLTDQQNSALRFDNGVMYHKGGLRGLIVVRQNASTYFAFERNCPYQPYNTCARVHIDASHLFLADSCCGSQFSLLGQIQGGPTALPLRQYSTSLSGNLLTITN